MFRFICETVNLFTIQNYFYLGKIQAYLEDDHLRRRLEVANPPGGGVVHHFARRRVDLSLYSIILCY